MFTSRAEYRILLRQDNADLRLTPLSRSIGLATEERYKITMEKYEKAELLAEMCKNVNLSSSATSEYFSSVGSALLGESKKISDLVSRPEVELKKLLNLVPRGTFAKYSLDSELPKDVVESVQISLKYKGYIDREKLQAEKLRRLEDLKIPADFDFSKLSGLTIECRQKLEKYKPGTIAQASRISGVSPADVSVLLVYFGR